LTHAITRIVGNVPEDEIVDPKTTAILGDTNAFIIVDITSSACLFQPPLTLFLRYRFGRQSRWQLPKRNRSGVNEELGIGAAELG
jgi:hypothetical protein